MLRVAFLFMIVAFFVSCEKSPLSDPEKKPDIPQPVNPTDTVARGDSADVYLTVLQAKAFAEKMQEDSTFTITANGIVGYIVGVINGTSLVAADFNPPFMVRSNILIADNPVENNVDKCMPVQLANNTSFRNELNLADNPANLGKKIIVEGSISDYFRTYGIKPLTSYQWVSVGSDSTTTNPADNNPVISDKTEVIEGGR